MKKNKFYHLGVITVDSGLICIGDPCYLVDSKDGWKKFVKKIIKYDLNRGMEYDNWFISSTVYGDGYYNVSGMFDDKNRLIKLAIDLLPDCLTEEDDELPEKKPRATLAHLFD